MARRSNRLHVRSSGALLRHVATCHTLIARISHDHMHAQQGAPAAPCVAILVGVISSSHLLHYQAARKIFWCLGWCSPGRSQTLFLAVSLCTCNTCIAAHLPRAPSGLGTASARQRVRSVQAEKFAFAEVRLFDPAGAGWREAAGVSCTQLATRSCIVHAEPPRSQLDDALHFKQNRLFQVAYG